MTTGGPPLDPTPLALTMGEPAGIGGELALKAWAERIGKAVPSFVLLDDPDRIRALAKRIGLDVPVEVVGRAGEAVAVFGRALPVLPTALDHPAEPG